MIKQEAVFANRFSKRVIVFLKEKLALGLRTSKLTQNRLLGRPFYELDVGRLNGQEAVVFPENSLL